MHGPDSSLDVPYDRSNGMYPPPPLVPQMTDDLSLPTGFAPDNHPTEMVSPPLDSTGYTLTTLDSSKDSPMGSEC